MQVAWSGGGCWGSSLGVVPDLLPVFSPYPWGKEMVLLFFLCQGSLNSESLVNVEAGEQRSQMTAHSGSHDDAHGGGKGERLFFLSFLCPT